MSPTPDLSHAEWVKSSYSNGAGGACLEWAPAYAHTEWVKSTHSGNGGAECLEWAPAHAASGIVPVRDSKTPNGPALILTPVAWASFVSAAQSGAFGDC
jgi:hypothetical protein